MSWSLLELGVDLIIGIVGGLVAVLAVWWLWRPHLELGKQIKCFASGTYDVTYWNTSWFALHSVQVDVWIRTPDGVGFAFLHVPVSVPCVPGLERKGKSERQTPTLRLDAVHWAKVDAMRHYAGRPLEEVLSRAKTTLVLHVTATSAIGQITTVKVQRYGKDAFTRAG